MRNTRNGNGNGVDKWIDDMKQRRKIETIDTVGMWMIYVCIMHSKTR